MPLILHNSLTKKREEFKPLKKGKVSLYVCGPTVYDYIHIGNARTFLAFDVIKRWLKYRGYKVKHVQNITDVGHLTEDQAQEDKLVKAAKKKKITPLQLAKLYTDKYHNVMRQLNWDTPDVEPKATEHIKDMQDLVKKIIKNGYGYEVEGAVYFDSGSFDGYGKLSGNTIEKLEHGKARKKVDEEKFKGRKSIHDFALWLPAPKNHAMKWESDYGVGYPGWHIECSAMSTKHLGVPFDIHGGGKDLRFPHHENEIAQSEAGFGKEFSRYWLHSEFLLINGEKMSKSKGNFLTAQEFIDKWGADVARFFLISSHYQTELNITEKGVKSAQDGLEKLKNTVRTVSFALEKDESGKVDKKFLDTLKKHITTFEEEMDNNFNTPGAINALFLMSNELNKAKGNAQTLSASLDLFVGLASVLGIELEESEQKVPQKVLDLVDKREQARKSKDWQKADKIRDKVKELGFEIRDTDSGAQVRKI